ncbi:MAG: phospholipase A [Congregibacter sp.]|nr:phospholipase A [Congregibacter sp.]
MPYFRAVSALPGPLLVSLLLVSLLLASPARANPETCAYIPEATARLNCFDSYFTPEELPAISSDGQAELLSEAVPALSLIEARFAQEAVLTDQWFSITPHHPNYILPLTFTHDPDYADFGPLAESFSDYEIKMQLSIKTRLAQGLWRDSSVWAAYTQQSYWQLYAEDSASAPFRETNHQPEVFWQIPLDFEVFGWHARATTLAVNHQSNGRSEPLSRSWNRVTAELAMDRGNWVISAKTWARINESEDADDNPNIEDYMGRLQLGVIHKRERHTVSIGLKNNLSSPNRSGLELNYTFPLFSKLKGFVQLYSGYGENLIDMESYNNRIGIGIALTDWL